MPPHEAEGGLPTVPQPQTGSQALPLIVPQAPQPKPNGISVTRLHVPLPLVLGFLLVVLGGVISMTIVYAKTTDHVANALVHINQASAIKGGGVAYKRDVDAVERKFEKAMRAEHSKTRKMLKGMKISCRAGNRRGQLNCDITLPELD